MADDIVYADDERDYAEAARLFSPYFLLGDYADDTDAAIFRAIIFADYALFLLFDADADGHDADAMLMTLLLRCCFRHYADAMPLCCYAYYYAADADYLHALFSFSRS